MSKVSKRRRTGWLVAAVAVLVTAAAVAANGVKLLDLFGAPAANSKNKSDRPPATAQVTRETLVDTKVVSGDLGYGGATKVTPGLRGTLTALAGTGKIIKRGKVLYRVDNTPIVLLYGKLPEYRALSVGKSGADVKQFERNLWALGYRGFTIDKSYTSSTSYAVKEWQKDLGLTQTGSVKRGRVFYAPRAVRIESHKAAKGDPVAPGSPVLTYTGTDKVITAQLPYEYRRLAKIGTAVTVTLPDDDTAPGKVTHSVMVVKPAESTDESDTTVMEVTITLKDPKKLAKLDEAAMRVAFVVAERKDVLTVPVAALLALPKGGYGVELVENGKTRTVQVQTGLFADGRVEISSDQITEGATVGMPE